MLIRHTCKPKRASKARNTNETSFRCSKEYRRRFAPSKNRRLHNEADEPYVWYVTDDENIINTFATREQAEDFFERTLASTVPAADDLVTKSLEEIEQISVDAEQRMNNGDGNLYLIKLPEITASDIRNLGELADAFQDIGDASDCAMANTNELTMQVCDVALDIIDQVIDEITDESSDTL